VDHGKTTLADHLIGTGGMLPGILAGHLRALDYLESEQERGITIEASIASFTIEQDETYLINLIDTPGHVDFSGKVTDALYLVDNSLIIVDAVEGVMAQTITVLHQALREQLNLVLFINKIDRLITELHFDKSQLRGRIEGITGETHVICQGTKYQGLIPSFSNNRVLIGSALHGWAVDQLTATEIGGIDRIISLYAGGFKKENIPAVAKIGIVFKNTMVSQFIAPDDFQQLYYPKENYRFLADNFSSDLQHCVPSGKVMCQVGKKFRDDDKDIISLVRIISGTLSTGQKLYSLSLRAWVQVIKILQFRGNRSIALEQASAGYIVGIVGTLNIPTGDILLPEEFDGRSPALHYIQEPVISQVIEPVNYEDIDDLIDELTIIAQIYPNVQFEQRGDTGELVISGIGPLQLEIILEELEEQGFDIYISPPQRVEYLALETDEQQMGLLSGNTAHAFRNTGEYVDGVIYTDDLNNSLKIHINEGSLDEKAILSIFHTKLRNPVRLRGKIRELGLDLDIHENIGDLNYEETLVYFTQLLNQVFNDLGFVPVRPWVKFRVRCPESYIGRVVNEIQKLQGTVLKIITQETEQIIAMIPVEKMTLIVDTLRRAADGNILWEILSTEYIEK